MTPEEQDVLNLYAKTGNLSGLNSKQREIFGGLPLAAIKAAKDTRKESPAKVAPKMMAPPPRYKPPSSADVVADQEMKAAQAAVESSKAPIAPAPAEMTPGDYLRQARQNAEAMNKPAPDVITRASEAPPAAGPAVNTNIPIQRMNPPAAVEPEKPAPVTKAEPTKPSDIQETHKKLQEVSSFFKSQPEGNVIADILDAVGVGLSAYGGTQRQTMRQKKAEAELGTAQRQKEIEMQTAAQKTLQQSQADIELANMPEKLRLQYEQLKKTAPLEAEMLLKRWQLQAQLETGGGKALGLKALGL